MGVLGMRTLQSLSIIVIALVLISDVHLDRAYPFVSLLKGEDELLQAARLCHEAISANKLLSSIVSRVDDAKAQRLHQSAEVSLISCRQKDALRHALASAGVTEQSLDAIEFSALQTARVRLSYYVSGARMADE
jgi:hypothetical protein